MTNFDGSGKEKKKVKRAVEDVSSKSEKKVLLPPKDSEATKTEGENFELSTTPVKVKALKKIPVQVGKKASRKLPEPKTIVGQDLSEEEKKKGGELSKNADSGNGLHQLSAFEKHFIGGVDLDIDADYIINKITNEISREGIEVDTSVKLPVLCLKDVVCFPNSIVPLFVGRSHSMEAIEKAVLSNSAVFLVTEKNSGIEDVSIDNVYSVGCIGRVIQKIKLPNDTLRVLIDVQYRAKVNKYFYSKGDKFVEALVEVERRVGMPSDVKFEALKRSLVEAITKYASVGKKINASLISSLFDVYDAEVISDIVMNKIPFGIKKKQEVLEISDVVERLEKILAIILMEIEILEAEALIQTNVKAQVEKNQKEYYLQEQIKAIRKELGDSDGISAAVEKYEKELRSRDFPDAVRQKIQEEIKRLKSSNSMSTETIISYLDILVFLPWGRLTKVEDIDLAKAARILEESHYGLEKVKASVLEYIVAQSVNPKGTVLCLYGPPGIGKTSLVKSIAKAMGREYGKIALGGVRDEAEIRGHRKTYVSAMPGKIVQTIKKLGVDNPVILLDEIDKMAHDQRGDPESAMLEVLDPEQNQSFQDNYLGVEYDLSKVVFISTANTLNMQRPLLDRLDIVDVSSYLEFERREISKNYIIPRTLKEHGLSEESITFEDDAIDEIIKHYTREAGVRSVDRIIKKIVRKCLVKLAFVKAGGEHSVANDPRVNELDYIKKMQNIPIVEGVKGAKIVVTKDSIKAMIGPRFYSDSDVFKKDLVGVTHGLAYTEVGGTVLLVEAIKSHGKGDIKITGKLGEVMKESFQAAMSYIKHRLNDWNINGEDLKHTDIHIHVPAGAVPKDGPSAGVTICTTIASLLLNIPVKSTVAMTGEISLRGNVLPIGGLREKMVAAIKGGIKTILIPKDNVKDLEEIPNYVTNAIEIIPCEFIDEVLEHALAKKIEKKPTTVDSARVNVPAISGTSDQAVTS